MKDAKILKKSHILENKGSSHTLCGLQVPSLSKHSKFDWRRTAPSCLQCDIEFDRLSDIAISDWARVDIKVTT